MSFLAKTTLPDLSADQPSLFSKCTVARNYLDLAILWAEVDQTYMNA
jgi:hypothetical protein